VTIPYGINGAATPAEICRRTWEAGELVRRWPPQLANPNKQLVYDLACPPGTSHQGTITCSRWTAGTLPDTCPADRAVQIEMRSGFFQYPAAAPDDPPRHWHVNFADRHLFYAYGTSLFAQDELQVAEHPALGAVREALLAEEGVGCMALTEDPTGPTPVLVRGVARRCAINTDGLYGYRFGVAGADHIRAATHRLEPPTVSNILAIAAPSSGRGAYSEEQVARILLTAWAGFTVARLESAGPVTIHTGFWGCGVFGGNRILMTTLQLVAAQLAGTEQLVFYIGGRPGDRHAFEAGSALAGSLLDKDRVTSDLIAAVVEQRLMWGKGDGN
jgi:hypothetical protein